MTMQTFLRFGMHRDAELYHAFAEERLYEWLLIPAHILAYQEAPTAALAASLPVPYVIDPMTHIFCAPAVRHRSERTGALRPSVRKLADAYSTGLTQRLEALLQDSPEAGLTARDLRQIADEFVHRCLTFQETQVSRVLSDPEDRRIQRYISRYVSTEARVPSLLVPPYFFADSVGRTDPFYELSLHCANTFRTGVPKERRDRVCPVLALTPQAVSAQESRDAVASDYRDFKRVFIWIDNYDQDFQRSDSIRNVADLVNKLSVNAEVFSLYGGFLLMLMAPCGMSGCGHGIVYGEHKSQDLLPGAGGPPLRYYIPAFHEFRSLAQTALILGRFPELVCRCEVCAEVLRGRPSNLDRFEEDEDLLKEHYLRCRQDEKGLVSDTPSLVAELEQMRGTTERCQPVLSQLINPDAFVTHRYMPGVQYLETWSSAATSWVRGEQG